MNINIVFSKCKQKICKPIVCCLWWYLLTSEQQLFGNTTFFQTTGIFLVSQDGNRHYVAITGKCKMGLMCTVWHSHDPDILGYKSIRLALRPPWFCLVDFACWFTFLSPRQREQHFRHEQWGQSVGEIEIENQEKTKLSLKGVRSHSYGNSTRK